MSCTYNGTDVNRIFCGSQEVVKVMRNGVSLWEKTPPTPRFVAVGSQGRSAYLQDGSDSWTMLPSLDSNLDFNAIAYGRGRFLASIGGFTGETIEFKVVRMNDGKSSWSNSFDIPNNSGVNGAAHGNGRNVFVGTTFSGSGEHEEDYKTYSLSVIDGSSSHSTLSPAEDKNTMIGVAYGNGMFVAGTAFDKGVRYLMDGSNAWISIPGDNTPLQGRILHVAYGGGRFLALCNGGWFYALENGSTSWTQIPKPSFDRGGEWLEFNMLNIAYGNGRFVAVGQGYSSCLYDGETTWTNLSNQTGQRLGNDSIAFGNGRFVATYSNTGTCHSLSGNSTEWEQIGSIDIRATCMAYGN